MTNTIKRSIDTPAMTLVGTAAAGRDAQHVTTITIVRNGMVDSAERDVAAIVTTNTEGQTYSTERIVGPELDEYVARHLATGWSLQF